MCCGNLGISRKLLHFFGCVWLVCSCVPSMVRGQNFGSQLRDVPCREAGIDFVHTDGGSGRRYIMESVIGSLALFDYDGDGCIDIYLVNGAALPGTTLSPAPTNRLYRNNGDWTFSDTTEAAGVGDAGYGMGVVVGDYDQDGDPDLFLSNFGRNRLFVNQGDGTFVEAAAASGVEGPLRFGAGNTFLDIDGDGDLDLYCASYVDFDYRDYKVRTIAGHQFHTGPLDYPPARDWLYRNEGDGTFLDISEAAGIAQLRAPGMGVLSADFDDDGDFDIFVANDQHANFMLMNDGHGNFIEDGLLCGIGYDQNGKANGNMGNDYADLNGDQLLDLVTTTYQEEMPVLYRGVAPGLYTDATNVSRLDRGLTAHVSWGVGAIDFDNDGDRDLLIACGHFLDNIQYIDDRTAVKVPNFLLANDGRGQFSRVPAHAGSTLEIVESSRAAGFDDLDGDGDVDGVILNFNAPPSLFRNDSPPNHHSLTLRLVGVTSNRDAIGARVVLHDDQQRQQVQVVMAGRGYESSYGQQLYFGTGVARATRVQVRWPSGLREEFAVDARTHTLIEGTGR